MPELVVSGVNVSFTPRLIEAYKTGKVSWHQMLCAIDQEGMDWNNLDKIEVMMALDKYRTEPVEESNTALCRCGKQGYISLDPYMDEIEEVLEFDIYCDTCWDESCDEI